MKKQIYFAHQAEKEYRRMPRAIRIEFASLIHVLEKNGELREPNAKKLRHKNSLFEMRVRKKGQWRSIYSYHCKNKIVILCFFIKKTSKTPRVKLDIAIQRRKALIMTNNKNNG